MLARTKTTIYWTGLVTKKMREFLKKNDSHVTNMQKVSSYLTGNKHYEGQLITAVYGNEHINTKCKQYARSFNVKTTTYIVSTVVLNLMFNKILLGLVSWFSQESFSVETA